MISPTPPQAFRVALDTPAGKLEAEVSVPAQIIPISEVVPLFRSFGEQGMRLVEEKERSRGKHISCHKGCAACCRMMVPVSPPEAFTLSQSIGYLPKAQQTRIKQRLTETKAKLHEAGLLSRLVQLSDTSIQMSDKDLDPLNQAYYTQRLPCPFLEDEVCSIYDIRPAACRELLVTSPPELCQDLAKNPVRPLAVHLRIGTILSLLWQEFTQGPARLIPLPLAIDWAERHRPENTAKWTGVQILEKGINYMWGFLKQTSQNPTG